MMRGCSEMSSNRAGAFPRKVTAVVYKYSADGCTTLSMRILQHRRKHYSEDFTATASYMPSNWINIAAKY